MSACPGRSMNTGLPSRSRLQNPPGRYSRRTRGGVHVSSRASTPKSRRHWNVVVHRSTAAWMSPWVARRKRSRTASERSREGWRGGCAGSDADGELPRAAPAAGPWEYFAASSDAERSVSSRIVSSRSGCPVLSAGGDVPRSDPFDPGPPRDSCGEEEALWPEALRSKTERRERRVSRSSHSAGVTEWR